MFEQLSVSDICASLYDLPFELPDFPSSLIPSPWLPPFEYDRFNVFIFSVNTHNETNLTDKISTQAFLPLLGIPNLYTSLHVKLQISNNS